MVKYDIYQPFNVIVCVCIYVLNTYKRSLEYMYEAAV